MIPKLQILPAPQQRLWRELSQIPEYFILYGGTAIALHLGGRQSIDFDFFTSHPIAADTLIQQLPFLKGAELIQAEPNTATFTVNRNGEIKVSFFGGLGFGRIGEPFISSDNRIRIASLLDLAAQKMKVILVRAELKDYLDIHTLLQHGIKLPDALGAAKALYPEFNPLLSLKALTYFDEPSLALVPEHVRHHLTTESAKVGSISVIPKIHEDLSAKVSIRQQNTQSQNRGIRI